MNTTFKVRNPEQFKKAVDREAERIRKASITAAKVEGYRLMRLLKSEIQAGAPGGKSFSPLSVIRAMKLTGGRVPLKKIGYLPKYTTIEQGGVSKTMIGFLYAKLPRKAVMLADRHQDSFNVSADAFQWGSTTLRRMFARQGGKIKDKAVAKYFFLRKETKMLKTPKRMMIAPFWESHRAEAARNIKSNFERKLRGERI